MKDTRCKLEAGKDNGKEYNIEAIWNSVVYARESKGHLPGLYDLIL